MDTIFKVRNEDLERLNPEEAVDFFRELLWAEARRIGLPLNKIHISSWIDVPDGGVDVVVEKQNGSIQEDLIKDGLTAYQIKTGKFFKPWQKAKIKKELFGSKSVGKGNLGSSVRNCLDRDGKYIMVCFQQDPVDPQRRKAEDIHKEYFKLCNYPNPKVEVWGQSILQGYIKAFPSLALEVNRRHDLRFQTHRSWSQEAEMKRDFVAGKKQKDVILNMQKELRKNDEAVHIRVWGEPGIGKTRLVLELTRADDLKPLVIYYDAASKFRDSNLMNEIMREDNTFFTVLVIDECDPDSRSYIWNKLKYCGPRIKLISIYNDYDDTSGQINYLNIPPLEKEQASTIIQGYGIPKDQADRWVEFCSGFPSVAHVFGQNLKNNPEDVFKSPDTVNMWDRHIVRGDDPDSHRVQHRRLVLRHLALFKRFGYKKPFIAEAKAIARVIAQAEPQITWLKFLEIIKDLRAKKILQGEYTLYITPKGLHVKLWIDWWDTYGDGFSWQEFSQSFPLSLHKWFYDMFVYAAESEVSARIVKYLLSKSGPFNDDKYLKTKLGARFFWRWRRLIPKRHLAASSEQLALGVKQSFQISLMAAEK